MEAIPLIEIDADRRIFSRSQGNATNSVIIVIKTKSEEILLNQRTGQRYLTGRSTPVSRPVVVDFNLRSSNYNYILSLVQERLNASDRVGFWICGVLATEILTEANALGFGHNVFALTLTVTLTYQTVVVMSESHSPSKEDVLMATVLRLILLGKKISGGEEETREPCSICLDDISCSDTKHGFPTKMECSHVFHSRCLKEWLQRKNTCPLCRCVLYEQ
ncbi:unnamed protein product [Cochlearia groenlandica]